MKSTIRKDRTTFYVFLVYSRDWTFKWKLEQNMHLEQFIEEKEPLEEGSGYAWAAIRALVRRKRPRAILSTKVDFLVGKGADFKKSLY